MLNFEVINELSLKVTCTGNDVLFTKAGAFIAGESQGGKNYRFEKLLLGPQSNLMQAALGSLTRRVTRENLPLMKVTMNGDSVTYYANHGQHVVVYKLAQGEILSVESENILAFTQDCDYSVRFIGCGIFSQERSGNLNADRSRSECLCRCALGRQPNRHGQHRQPCYNFCRPGCRDLLDEPPRIWRSADPQ